jgi:hypothetical protein
MLAEWAGKKTGQAVVDAALSTESADPGAEGEIADQGRHGKSGENQIGSNGFFGSVQC